MKAKRCQNPSFKREKSLLKKQKDYQLFDRQEHFLFSSFDITEEVVENLILPAKINFFQAYMDMFVKRRKEIFDELRKKEMALINQESTSATTSSL